MRRFWAPHDDCAPLPRPRRPSAPCFEGYNKMGSILGALRDAFLLGLSRQSGALDPRVSAPGRR
jgi:hypothetical protein